MREVLGRQEEEREHLLQFLQDDSMDDLREAAAMMAEPETKARLAELHTKRRRLDLSNQGILEMETFFFQCLEDIHVFKCYFKNIKIKQIHVNI